MPGLYIGSTSGFSGKNMLTMALGLHLQKEGYSIGYMKPIGAVPSKGSAQEGDADAFFVQDVLGLQEDPSLVTPVLVTEAFKKEAFTSTCPQLLSQVQTAYQSLEKGKDLVLVGGSGSFLYSGKYCGVDGLSVSKGLSTKVLLIDRYRNECNYDYLLAAKEFLGDQLIGVVLNDVPASQIGALQGSVEPMLQRQGVPVLGMIPHDPLMGAIKIADLAERLGGRIISAPGKADRVIENFLIGTMQVENFMTHFRRHQNSAILVGGDRSDLQLVALEGKCPCLILTGNLYPNDLILSRSEVLETPIIVVREDTYSVAQKMERILGSVKLRDMIKINHGAQLVNSAVDFAAVKRALGLHTP